VIDNIRQINNYCFDERFYEKTVNIDGKEFLIYQPSVTHIISCTYPKDFGLLQWRGDVGNKRAEEILDETSADGTFVHRAIEEILTGKKIVSSIISTNFSPKRSLKIKRCLKAFLDWAEEYKPKVLKTEFITWSDKWNFAGTVDLLCEIKGETYLVDFKTSKSIQRAHKVQICAYGMGEPVKHVALLQLGNTTKKKYSFNVLKQVDRVKYTKQFIETNKLFKIMNPNAKPNSETFPEFFELKKEKKDEGTPKNKVGK